ncbi:hypothetical protein V8G54_033266 [Vigna mungo]|uniref:FAR1-related sequence 11-like HTH-like domain-containing protein n=1 Tax=Vigna mungo TaxID=3915 RepID=A0AAQ3MNP8_VIGMU
MVTCFENSHNHVLLDEKEIRFLPAYRDIPINGQARILLLSKVGCSINLIMRVLEAEKGIETGHLPFLDKDIRNFIKSQSTIDKDNDASDVLKLCKGLKDKDDVFQYDFTLDESNKLEHIIWVFGYLVGVAVNNRNQAGEEARMCQKYHNPLMKMSFPIEEHAAFKLKPYAFELLQHEIELSTKYAVIDNDSYSLKNEYFSILEEYLPSRWRRESSLIPQSRHIINYNDNSSVEFRSLVQCLEVDSLKTKDRVEVATKELKKVTHYLKGMPEVQENSIDLEHGIVNVDECDVENPITSKTKGRPRGSRAKGGVEAAKKSRHCHYPNCGGTDHDS